MRTRDEILKDHREYNVLTLEVLLDIRDLLEPKEVKQTRKTKKQRKIPKTVYECEICHKTFSYAFALSGHKRSHKNKN